jgi:uncharacterized membrane protein
MMIMMMTTTTIGAAAARRTHEHTGAQTDARRQSWRHSAQVRIQPMPLMIDDVSVLFSLFLCVLNNNT